MHSAWFLEVAQFDINLLICQPKNNAIMETDDPLVYKPLHRNIQLFSTWWFSNEISGEIIQSMNI